MRCVREIINNRIDFSLAITHNHLRRVTEGLLDCLGVINGNRKPALVKTESFFAITMAKVTRKNARQESTIMIAISQDNLSAVEPASDHSLSREMHLKAKIDYTAACAQV